MAATKKPKSRSARKPGHAAKQVRALPAEVTCDVCRWKMPLDCVIEMAVPHGEAPLLASHDRDPLQSAGLVEDCPELDMTEGSALSDGLLLESSGDVLVEALRGDSGVARKTAAKCLPVRGRTEVKGFYGEPKEFRLAVSRFCGFCVLEYPRPEKREMVSKEFLTRIASELSRVSDEQIHRVLNVFPDRWQGGYPPDGLRDLAGGGTTPLERAEYQLERESAEERFLHEGGREQFPEVRLACEVSGEAVFGVGDSL